ncbi:hypothetical protein L486_05196 [Kwoniella mangroviensis CBS 10435]|uniref:Uncharacterized protein n=1 Tax=Kwoniella mangroviensis CBS 10435 TaxID=1331196 RepID=A0A1B9IQD8_9TREE|nr:uncharacterized protein I203_00074 [Kwoniella mangroviensis CBS 8507]OCF57731.1 hypothetical protein L486_05196 [Kwoniella mangroviensis CBS 10435]OCF69947.1 hypothetical protein I203_00074 [Kwoniella mangroviensis CBS 8507]
MASSMVPTSAQMKVKKRVVNLVNPADPQDFSAQSISPSTSPNTSAHMEEEPVTEEKITPPIMRFSERTQTFNFTPGVKGILRSTGTPGSGNGVRFFPKNKFRIITPNASVHQPTPKPPASPTNSFFSQLLAVTIPSMSPRRGSASGEVKGADESWEIPGQEGEISLVASSIASGDRSIENHNWDEQVDEREIDESIDDVREDSWNGQPQIHCSPLALPEGDANTSKETSLIGFELPSTELQYPDDMSNLLSTRFQPEDPSFSINDLPSSNLPTAKDLQTLSPIKEDLTNRTEDEFWNVPTSTNVPDDRSGSSEHSDLRAPDLSDPTIRRPITSAVNASDQTTSPTPIGRPYNTSSIFADMSAEQAELTWPLTRRNEDDDQELDSNFPTPIKSSSPPSSKSLQTPKAGAGAGDITQFFDTTMTMSFTSPSPEAIVLRSSSSFATQAQDFMVPTQKLFEAQVAHTSALTAELELYKDLAKKLQDEVVERDECLAKLNLRALEAEVLHDQVQDLQREMTSLRSESRRKSLSPSPVDSPTLLATAGLRARQGVVGMSDRTMAAQSEAKELEIRLAKTLADSEDMGRELHQVQIDKKQLKDELNVLRIQKQEMEDQERDRLVKEQGHIDEIELLRKKLEDAHQRIDGSTNGHDHEEEIRQLQEELKEAHQHIVDLQSYEDEMHALKAELDSAHRQLYEYESRHNDEDNIQKDREDARTRLDQVEQELEDTKRQLGDKEQEVHTLQDELDKVNGQLDNWANGSMVQHELDEAKEKIKELKIHVKELTENKLVDEDEIETLLNQVDKFKGYRKSEEEMKKRVNEVENRLDVEISRRKELEKRFKDEEELVRELEKENEHLRYAVDQAEQLAQASSSNAPSLSKMKEEITKLRSESASKDLEILNLQRRKTELKEDREMLNIALDSKQQELELMKRKFAVKGIAGSTPLGTSQKTNIGISSTTLETPLVGKGIQTRRRSSLAQSQSQTPLVLPNVPKHLPSSLQTPINGRRASYGVQLHPSTRIANRVMKRLEEENDEQENQPPVHEFIRSRRQRVLA